MSLNHTLTLAFALLASTSLQAAERNFPVGGFDGISVSGSEDVTVTTGKTASVHVIGSESDIDRMEIEVRGGVLHIGPKSKWNWSWNWKSGPVQVKVTVPMINMVSMAGSGDIVIDRIVTPSFTAEIAGSGSINAVAVKSQQAHFSIAGSGTITAAGSCDGARTRIAGSGDIHIDRLACATLDASIAGSGDTAAQVSKTAKVSIMGSGDVRIAGGAVCTVSKMGSGNAYCGGKTF